MSGLFSMDAWSTVWNHKESFLLGLGNTLQTAVCALALAFAIGALLGLMATSGNKILKFVARVYVEFIQNTPLLLQLCFLYYALAFAGLSLGVIRTGIIALGVYTGAYMGEVVRAAIVGVLVGALFSMKVGKELVEDPEYQKRLKEGLFNNKKIEIKDVKNKRSAMISVLIFILATAFIVLFGSFEGMRPSFLIDGEIVTLGMSSIIEIVMLSAAAIILLVTKTDGIKATQGSVFPAGMQAVIAIFGIAWMGDTFLQGNMGQLTLSIEGIVQQMPWLFGVALFVMSILLYSQAATVRALVPLGIALGISPYMLIALFPAVNGYFFIPNYPTVVAAINFDRTGTTKIGKYVLNHSFMMPGLVSTVVAIALGLLFIQIF